MKANVCSDYIFSTEAKWCLVAVRKVAVID